MRHMVGYGWLGSGVASRRTDFQSVEIHDPQDRKSDHLTATIDPNSSETNWISDKAKAPHSTAANMIILSP